MHRSTGCIEPEPSVNETDCWEKMKMLGLKYPKKIIIGYINAYSIRNKFEQFANMINDKIDILVIAENELNPSFQSGQFSITGFKTPLRLDVNENSGGLLVYIEEDILSKELQGIRIPNGIQAVPAERNIRKAKWLIVQIY